MAEASGKSFLESKTFWGLAISVGMPLLAKHGIVVDASGLATDIAALGGALLAIYGRLTASRTLKLK